MPSTYAVVENSTGLVTNVILWDGESEYSAGDGYSLIQSDEAVVGGAYADNAFTPPPPPPVIPPTAAETLSANTSQRDSLLASASSAMTPLLVSLQLGDATDEETSGAKAWQAYTRALKAVDLTASDPAWPTIPA